MVKVIYDMSEDTKIREIARLREKALHDEASALKHAKDEGMTEGIAIGEERGIAKGRTEGIAIGEERGIAKGRTEGIAKAKAEIIEKMKASGMTDEQIKEILS